MQQMCPNCRGGELCAKHKVLNEFQSVAPRVSLHFSGPSPPEIFVGRIGYPNINVGILAPATYDTKHDLLSSAEDWSKNNLSISNVLRLRGQLIYGRTMSHIKRENRVKSVVKELALTSKRVSTEFFLKRRPVVGDISSSSIFRPMTNPAPIKKVLLEENTKVIKKVDYLVNDTDCLATNALKELSGHVRIDHMQKLLSAGMLGRGSARKMVPTRWSITAVDDTISKQMLERIRYYSEVDSVEVFEGSYLGNYISVLILPGQFSFEGIEVWEDQDESEDGGESEGMGREAGGGNEHDITFAQDYEGFNGRRNYASNITGGYYAMRFPVCEYLDRVRRQGVVLVFREITKEYYAPLGVGVVREATRRAVNNKSKVFESVNDAVSYMNKEMRLDHDYLARSWILENYGRQKRLIDFF